MRFQDRSEAGKHLALKLSKYANDSSAVVLALPRGGVPVAYEVARTLHLPLDVFLVRKLGVPGQEELAMGAIASGGVRVLNEEVVNYLHIPEEIIAQVANSELSELGRRERLYRGGRAMPSLKGKTILLVDDGLATGATMKAAVAALRQQHPARIVVAAPVAAHTTCEAFESMADDIVCVCDRTYEPFHAVGLWYEDFRQTTDAEVRILLDRANASAALNGKEPIAA
ncbi:MAG TPA: phosphoribosyltransferase [Blastocatellia bacterium]|nr:phosphoribosyltransferase [Blastocatellia bacterium]